MWIKKTEPPDMAVGDGSEPFCGGQLSKYALFFSTATCGENGRPVIKRNDPFWVCSKGLIPGCFQKIKE